MSQRSTSESIADFQTALAKRIQRAAIGTSSGVPPQELAHLLSLGDDFEVLATLVTDLLADSDKVRRLSPRVQAIARGVAVKRKLAEEAGGFISGNDVAAILNISRAAVAKQRKAGKLLSIPTPSGDYVFPACQFDEDGALPGLAAALGAFRSADPWYRLQVLLTPDPNLDGLTPLAILRRGEVDAVVRAIRAHDSI